MTEVFHADNLKALPGVRHGFFARETDDSANVYDSPDDAALGIVAENRRRVAGRFGLPPERMLTCRQVHSPDAVTVTAPWKLGDSPEADAMVTKERGLILGVLTADCVPVLLADAEAGVVGAAHAGWRGALGGVIANVITAMEKLGASRRGIRAALGPCIFRDSYEVGPEFPAPFLAEDPAQEALFRPSEREGHYLFDLPGYVTGKLRALGVRDVAPPPYDTCADPARFVSYRRCCLQGVARVGNQVSVIMLVG